MDVLRAREAAAAVKLHSGERMKVAGDSSSKNALSANALIVFARNPEFGKIKTRLAAQIGDAAALSVYEKLLRHTRNVAKQSDCDTYVFVNEKNDDHFWNEFFLDVQTDGDLGDKMRAAFNRTFSKGYQSVVIIGSDCPELQPSHVNEAFASLKSNDVVIGPAADGGYYLLGLKQMHDGFFQGKEWSTSRVYEQTMRDIRSLFLSCYQLPVLADIDEADDIPIEWPR